MLLPCSDIIGGFYQEKDHIHLPDRTFCRSHHILPKLVLGLVDTRCIGKDDLSLIRGINRADPVSGSLRFS